MIYKERKLGLDRNFHVLHAKVWSITLPQSQIFMLMDTCLTFTLKLSAINLIVFFPHRWTSSVYSINYSNNILWCAKEFWLTLAFRLLNCGACTGRSCMKKHAHIHTHIHNGISGVLQINNNKKDFGYKCLQYGKLKKHTDCGSGHVRHPNISWAVLLVSEGGVLWDLGRPYPVTSGFSWSDNLKPPRGLLRTLSRCEWSTALAVFGERRFSLDMSGDPLSVKSEDEKSMDDKVQHVQQNE